MPGQAWKQLGEFHAALAVSGEMKGGPQPGAGLFGIDIVHISVAGLLSVAFGQFGLWIEEVNLTRPAVLE